MSQENQNSGINVEQALGIARDRDSGYLIVSVDCADQNDRSKKFPLDKFNAVRRNTIYDKAEIGIYHDGKLIGVIKLVKYKGDGACNVGFKGDRKEFFALRVSTMNEEQKKELIEFHQVHANRQKVRT